MSAPIADAVGVAVWPEGKKWTQTLIVRVWLSAQVESGNLVTSTKSLVRSSAVWEVARAEMSLPTWPARTPSAGTGLVSHSFRPVLSSVGGVRVEANMR